MTAKDSRSGHGRRRRRWLRLLILCVVTMALAPMAASPAAAHAGLVRTTPGDGERLEEPPGAVVLEFTERVNPVRGGFRLLDASGAEVDGVRPRVADRTVVADLPDELATGGYVLTWRVVSSDTHPVSGAFSFGVRADPVDSSAVGPTEAVASGSPSVSLVRWLGFAGLALLAGGASFLLMCWPAGRHMPSVRQLVWVGWAVVGFAAVVALPVQGAHISGAGRIATGSPEVLADVLRSQFGLLHLTRVGLLVLAVPLLRRVLSPAVTPRWKHSYGGGLLALGLAATFAGTGHSASGAWSALALVSDSLHLMAVSLWVGGLVLLVAYALRRQHAGQLGGDVIRFSRLATTVVVVLAVTGLFQSWRTVGSLDPLLSTPYGRLLVTKVAVVAAGFAVGGLSMIAVRHARTSTLRRTVPIEVMLAALVLTVTAVLVVTPPARQSAGDPVGGPQSTELTLPNGDVVSLDLTPGLAGRNELHLYVTDNSGGPQDVEEISARVSSPGRDIAPLDVDLVGSGWHYFGEVGLPFPDEWRFDLSVQVTDLDAYVASATIQVGAGSQ